MIPLNPDEARYEVKFIASSLHKRRLLSWLRHHQAGFVSAYPDRQVNNIYFDNHNFSALNENIAGVSQRGKLRYRWYGESLHPGPGTLEFKIKHNCFGWKHLYKLDTFPYSPGDSWDRICRNLKKELGETERFLLGSYPCPIIINSYKRKYFICRDKTIRVTLDWDLRAFDQQQRFKPNLRKAKRLPDIIVVEFKAARTHREHLDQYIQNIPIRLGKHSKYVVGTMA